MSGPGDASRNSWQVSDNWWLRLLLVVLLLNGVDLKAVVLEEQVVLRVQTILQVVSVEDGLELSEELE
jgi:hypothetical protein